MDESQQYGQLNFNLPHDVVPLPSRGIFYKNKKDSIKVGYLTASDENILLAGGSDMTLNLLRAKIYEPGMRPEELMEGDVEAILIFLRNTSFGPTMDVTVTDPKTGNPFKTSVDLSELDIKKGTSPSEDGTWTVKLPVSGKSVKLKPLTFGESIELSKQLLLYPEGRIPPKRTLRLQREIVELKVTRTKVKLLSFQNKSLWQIQNLSKSFLKKMNQN